MGTSLIANVMGYKYVPYSYTNTAGTVSELLGYTRLSVGGKRHGVVTTSTLEFSNASATIDGVTAVASVSSTWRTNGPAFSGRAVLAMARVLAKEANAGLLNMGCDVLLRGMLGCKHMAVSEGMFPGNVSVGIGEYAPHPTISTAWEHWPGKTTGANTVASVIGMGDYASLLAGDTLKVGYAVSNYGKLGEDGIAVVPVHTSDLSSATLINWALCHMAWPRRVRAADSELYEVGTGQAIGVCSSMEVSSLALIDGPYRKVLFVVVDMMEGDPVMQFGATQIPAGAEVDISGDLDAAPVGLSEYPESWLWCVRKWYDYVGDRELAASALAVAADLSMLVDQPNVNLAIPHNLAEAAKAADPTFGPAAVPVSNAFSTTLRPPSGVGTNLVTEFPIGNGPFNYYVTHRLPWADHAAYVASASQMVKPVDVVDCPYFDAYDVDARTYRAARALTVYSDLVVRLTGIAGQMLYPGDVATLAIFGTLDMGMAMLMQKSFSKHVHEGIALLCPGSDSDFVYGGKNAWQVGLISPAYQGDFETPCTRLADWVVDSLAGTRLHVVKSEVKLDINVNKATINMVLPGGVNNADAVVGRTDMSSRDYRNVEVLTSILQLQTFWTAVGYHASMAQQGRWVPRPGDGLSKWGASMQTGDIWHRAFGLPIPVFRDISNADYTIWYSWGVPQVAVFVGRRAVHLAWNGLEGIRSGVAMPTVLVKYVGSDLFSVDYSSAVDEFRGFEGF